MPKTKVVESIEDDIFIEDMGPGLGRPKPKGSPARSTNSSLKRRQVKIGPPKHRVLL